MQAHPSAPGPDIGLSSQGGNHQGQGPAVHIPRTSIGTFPYPSHSTIFSIQSSVLSTRSYTDVLVASMHLDRIWRGDGRKNRSVVQRDEWHAAGKLPEVLESPALPVHGNVLRGVTGSIQKVGDSNHALLRGGPVDGLIRHLHLAHSVRGTCLSSWQERNPG